MKSKKEEIVREVTEVRKSIERNKKITKEIKALKLLFKDMDKEKMKMLDNVFYNAGFMSVQLKELTEHINEHGIKEEYQNGEFQKGSKESVEFKSYNSLIKNFLQAMKVLTDQLAVHQAKKITSDGFDEFVKEK